MRSARRSAARGCRGAVRWASGVALAAALCAPVAAAVDCPLRPFEAHYTVYTSGLPVGKGLIRLDKFEDNRYRMRSRIASSGLASLFVNDEINESVSGWIRDGIPRPVAYKQAHTGGDLDHISGAQFDWLAGSAATHYNGRQKTLKLKPRVVDPLSMYALLMSDLKTGVRKRRYRIANRARLKTYWIKHIGHDSLSTPMGRLNTWKVVRTRKKSTKVTTLWFAEDYDYMPAQIIHEKDGEVQFRVTLRSVTR